MLHLKKSYYEDLRYFDETYKRVLAALLILTLILLPFVFGSYLLYMFSLILVYLVITMGLNILIGNAGQLSLGHAAFVAIGAYTTAIISTRFSGIPFVAVMLIAGFIAVIASVIVGLPSLRLKFLYLALATMAFEFIIEEIILQWRTLTNGDDGMAVPRAEFFGFIFDSDIKVYYLILGTSLLMILLAKNIMRSNIGRGFEAIRDSDIAAPVMGINMGRYKLLAFGIGGFYAGIGGALFGYLMRFIGPANFT
ncbi:branched-chain amino acid ABC transporter permease, partial [Thermodesulfobacteriota bacterium]